MATLAEQTDPIFHSLFIRRRNLWRDKAIAEVVQAAKLTMTLRPGIAEGRPLRMLSIEGIDTKFFERNDHLLTTLLDVRFDGEISKVGLEAFLGAYADDDHWLLLMDLDGSLLPFRKQRVRSSDLKNTILPGQRLLIVENECCQHQLPDAPSTIAVLGTGFDLNWASTHADTKQIAYWGDIDTWGLQLLAKARETVGNLDALMMTIEVFRQFPKAAVVEPVVASSESPVALNHSECCLYRLLLSEKRGRLEQEFLPIEFIQKHITTWASNN